MNGFEMVIAGGTVVVPYQGEVKCDIGVRDGVVAGLGDGLQVAPGGTKIDATDKYVLPGAVDAHIHWGIYRPFADDVRSESESAVAGGVTTVLSYFRTGQHYLNKTGSYRSIFPEVVELTRGNAWCDFSYHVAPMTSEHLDEMTYLLDEWGITSFKNYMFYKGLNLAGDSADTAQFTMGADPDLGHLLGIMERASAAEARTGNPVSVSLHCEHSELIKQFMKRVQESGLRGLEAYSASRPPLTEELALAEAGILAGTTGCTINLLHLSSKAALEAAKAIRRSHPSLDVRIEATLHHLALTWDALQGVTAKVNPPIRTAEDVDALWEGIAEGVVDWVVSDHACCPIDNKQGELWHVLPGFGGSPLLYPTLLTLGWKKRGLGLSRMVELASANPARAFGLYPRKGTIAIGSDADFSIVDPLAEVDVSVDLLHSAQEYSPFEGMRMIGFPDQTILRGKLVFTDGKVVGSPFGDFIPRPAT